jgi:hypothetical protein
MFIYGAKKKAFVSGTLRLLFYVFQIHVVKLDEVGHHSIFGWKMYRLKWWLMCSNIAEMEYK